MLSVPNGLTRFPMKSLFLSSLLSRLNLTNKIKMKKIMVTSLSTGGSGGEDKLTENVTLNFAEVEFDYTNQLPTGGAGTMVPFKFDISKNA